MAYKVLDGAMGSELIRRGMILPNHIWSADANLSNPEMVHKIHMDYITAGADYIIANTFRTTPRAYRKAIREEQKIRERQHNNFYEQAENKAKISLHSAMKLAKKAAGDNISVIGSIAPLEDCYRPELFPGAEIAKKEIAQLGNWLVNAGADILILETMNSVHETFAGLSALRPLNVPIWVSFVLKDDSHLLSGESIKKAIQKIKIFDVDTVLLNCNPITRTEKAVDKLVDNWKGRWGVYPNLGKGEPSPYGNIHERDSIRIFLQLIEKIKAMGNSVVGGCCGSTPEHIQLIHSLNLPKFVH